MLDKWNNMGGSYNPVTAAARVVTEGVNTANMGTSDIADTGKKLTAFGADYAKDGKLDGDHGFRVQQVDPQGYMHSSDYSAGPSSRETSPWKFNGETNKTSTKHQD
jgi:hypothetical protein